MSVDLDGLHKIACGDDTKKVMVSRAWLREVHKELTELKRLRENAEAYQKMGGMMDELWKVGRR